MNCKEASKLISAELDHELTPEETAQLQQHLERCEACRQLQVFYQTLDATVSSLDEDPPERMAEGILYQIAPEKEHHRKFYFTGTAIAAVAAVFLLLLGANLLQFPGHKNASQDCVTLTEAALNNDTNGSMAEVQEAFDSTQAAPSEGIEEAKSAWDMLPELTYGAQDEDIETDALDAAQLPTLVLQEIPEELADLDPTWIQEGSTDVQDLLEGAKTPADFVDAGGMYRVACYEVDSALLQTLSERYNQQIQFPGDMPTGNVYVILPLAS